MLTTLKKKVKLYFQTSYFVISLFCSSYLVTLISEMIKDTLLSKKKSFFLIQSNLFFFFPNFCLLWVYNEELKTLLEVFIILPLLLI